MKILNNLKICKIFLKIFFILKNRKYDSFCFLRDVFLKKEINMKNDKNKTLYIKFILKKFKI